MRKAIGVTWERIPDTVNDWACGDWTVRRTLGRDKHYVIRHRGLLIGRISTLKEARQYVDRKHREPERSDPR